MKRADEGTAFNRKRVRWACHLRYAEGSNKSDLPGIELAWVTMVDRLPSGNTRIVNCHAGPDNPQILEVTPEKEVVWTFKDFDHFGNALPVAQVIE